MSAKRKSTARPARRKRASSKSSKDRPYVRRSAVRELIENQIQHLERDLLLPELRGGGFAQKFAANTLRVLLHDLEAL